MPWWDNQEERILELPDWLTNGGQGSFPINDDVPVEALALWVGWAVPYPDVNGNGMTVWQSWWFKLPVYSATNAGRYLYDSDFVTPEALTKDVRWGSRDYALRKVADDWFFGASSTFGTIVERVRIPVLNGWGGGAFAADLVTPDSLVREHRHGNDDGRLKEVMEDWFFGRTAGSPDLHIVLTRRRYP